MRAVLCRDFSGPLSVEEIDAPQPMEDQVLIEVAASGVNFVDGLIVTGRYQLKPELPFVPGFEVAGTVVALGENVDAFEVGDRVFATPGLGGGGYAARVSVHVSQVFGLPDAMSFGQGATFVQSYCTALFSLSRRIELGPGQTLLVLGASGGVGRAAVDVGKALGARVIAAASSDERLDACKALQPDGFINYGQEDLKARARALGGGGVDVVYDPLGGEYSEAALRALNDDGALLIIGFAAGDIPRLPTNQVLLRNRRIIGVDWGGWRTQNPQLQRVLIDDLMNLVGDGRLHLREPEAYPLEQAVRALDDVNQRRIVGKAVLTP